MEWFLLGSLPFATLVCVLLLAAGNRVRGTARNAPSPPPDGWPQVSVIVPIAGTTKATESCLVSVLLQDYPAYEVIFVTRRRDEEPVPLIHGLIEERDVRGFCSCRHVVNDDATECGQKNHNLLAGIATVDKERKIFVFCDSSHLAPPHWLKRLVAPIANNESAVTTGYHHVLPGDRRLATWGRAATVSMLQRLQEIDALTQPWGGNTAIVRSLFEELKIGELWAKNVVDDVSLAAQLKEVGIKVSFVSSASLSTPLADEHFMGWSDWLTRQWLYLKFCFPSSWLMAGVMLLLLVLMLLATSACCFAAPMGFVSLDMALPAVCFLVFFSGFGEILRLRHPNPGPRYLWLLAFHVTVFMGCFCHIRSWFAREIHWHRISYRVTWKGRVKSLTIMES